MDKIFSERLLAISKSKDKTLNSVIKTFGNKAYMALFILLMATPALPIPTGGVTHVFEIIVALLCLELIIGRDSIWLPRSWLNKQLPDKLIKDSLPALAKKLEKIQSFSKPRLAGILNKKSTNRIIGLFILVFTIAAFIAPPFSGLDTLPALGVVIVGLGAILEDILIVITGFLVGLVGIGLVIFLGEVAIGFF